MSELTKDYKKMQVELNEDAEPPTAESNREVQDRQAEDDDELNAAMIKMGLSLQTREYKRGDSLIDLLNEIVDCAKFSTDNERAKTKLCQFLLNELDAMDFTEGSENN
ncbi:hypothetical protein KR018_010213 [Drosophila ironensis]|nr:hypothetical protein KR018_010213 [Drosophila ironensis]